MRPFEENRRTGTVHQELRRPAGAVNSGAIFSREIDDERFSNPVIATRKLQHAVAAVERVLDGRRVVGFTVAFGAEFFDVSRP